MDYQSKCPALPRTWLSEMLRPSHRLTLGQSDTGDKGGRGSSRQRQFPERERPFCLASHSLKLPWVLFPFCFIPSALPRPLIKLPFGLSCPESFPLCTTAEPRWTGRWSHHPLPPRAPLGKTRRSLGRSLHTPPTRITALECREEASLRVPQKLKEEKIPQDELSPHLFLRETPEDSGSNNTRDRVRPGPGSG